MAILITPLRFTLPGTSTDQYTMHTVTMDMQSGGDKGHNVLRRNYPYKNSVTVLFRT